MLRQLAGTLDAVDEKPLLGPSAGWPLWKQFYHALYWLDQQYLDHLTSAELERRYEVRGQLRSRFHMILGQHQHVCHYIGYICATFRSVTGRSIWAVGARE